MDLEIRVIRAMNKGRDVLTIFVYSMDPQDSINEQSLVMNEVIYSMYSLIQTTYLSLISKKPIL